MDFYTTDRDNDPLDRMHARFDQLLSRIAGSQFPFFLSDRDIRFMDIMRDIDRTAAERIEAAFCALIRNSL